MLVKGPSFSDNSKAVCAGFLQTYDSSKKEWQLGKTKVLHQSGAGVWLCSSCKVMQLHLVRFKPVERAKL